MDLRRLRRSLLRWFAKARRPLPWRATQDPYAIWVSEMMLQQTTVATVIPYYQRFLQRFPTTRALAASDEAAVLSLWSGLGYYSRARNLRLAAKEVVRHHHGTFPRDPRVAIKLPGIGPYAAHAITSIAFGAHAAVVDGNVRRVLSRLHAIRGLSDRNAQSLAAVLLSPRSPGRWNEAMMELGATLCTPRNPKCAMCPVASDCRGKDAPERWGQTKPRRATLATRVDMALICSEGRVLLAKNPPGRLMAGLYELPHSGIPGSATAPRSWTTQHRAIFELVGPPVATVRHTVTHHRIEARVFRGRLKSAALPPTLSLHPLEERGSLPLGGLTRKVLRVLRP